VATRAETEAVENNGKPAAKGAAVIRRVEVAEEEAGSRVLNRHLPAWVISGALHVVIIGFMLLVMSGQKEVAANNNDLVTTQVEEPKEDEKNLTNEDVGFDPDLAAATDAKREEAVNVDAPATEDPVGLPDQPNETAPQTAVQGVGSDIGVGAAAEVGDVGQQMGAGGGSAFARAKHRGRVWQNRRFAATYADLRTDPRYQPAVDFYRSLGATLLD